MIPAPDSVAFKMTMERMPISIWILGSALALAALSASAQGVRGVTYPMVKSPAPGLVAPPYFPFLPGPTNVAPAQPAAPSAASRVTIVYHPPPPPVDKSEVERKLLAFHRRRAAEGSPYAQLALGLRYLNGRSVKQDPALARKWLEASAKNGNSEARQKLLEMKDEASLQPAPPKPKRSSGVKGVK